MRYELENELRGKSFDKVASQRLMGHWGVLIVRCYYSHLTVTNRWIFFLILFDIENAFNYKTIDQ